MSSLLRTLYDYHAWANRDLFDTLENLDPEQHGAELRAALRLIGHSHVVSQIFASHLQGIPHGFTSDTLEETPALSDVRHAVEVSAQWYIDYIATVSPDVLSVALPFTFTDGDKGFMTREEMLTHVAVHAAYHRGEVGLILRQLSITPPWDTFAVYLHRTEPRRRLQRA